MRNRLRIRPYHAVLICGVALAITGVLASPAHAGNLVVAPSKVQLQSLAATTTSFTVSVSNTATLPVSVFVRPWDFARDAKGGVHEISPRDADRFRGCAAWVEKPTAKTIVVRPGTTEKLHFKVKIPAGTPDGSRYCYLDFRSTAATAPPDTSGQYGVRAPIVYSMNALLLVQVGNPLASGAPAYMQKISVRSFDVPRISFRPDVPITTAVRNEGTVHSNLAQGSGIQIWQGDRLRQTISFQEYTLLPESTIDIPAVWTSGALVAQYKARFIGAVENDTPLIAERTFWVVKPWFAVTLGAILLLLIVVPMLLLRRFRISFSRRRENEPVSEEAAA